MALHHRFSLIDPKETDILEDLEVISSIFFIKTIWEMGMFRWRWV